MKRWTPQQIAAAAGGRLLTAPPTRLGPERVVIDSRGTGPGSLFVGLPGENLDGGQFARSALEAGAWGTLTSTRHGEAAVAAGAGAVITAEDPLQALQRLATAWRRHLAAQVIGVTGSTGKTSTKDMLHAVLSPHRRTVASRHNFNTEIGLPLEILGAPEETEILVLEMAMRGAGQIAELAQIAEPEVGVIVSIGPVHLELLGTTQAIAAAKAELLAALPPDGTAIVPADEPLLEPHIRSDLRTLTFGTEGDVRLSAEGEDWVEITTCGETIRLSVPFTQAHLRKNLLAAVAAAQAVGVTPGGQVEMALSPGRGQRVRLPSGVTVIDDCYNANPLSMRAALDDLAATAGATGATRQVAILGDMLELGPDADAFHREIGDYANRTGVDVLIAVGPLARSIAEPFAGEVHCAADAGEAARAAAHLLAAGDVVLVKASRGIGLELVCSAIGVGAAV